MTERSLPRQERVREAPRIITPASFPLPFVANAFNEDPSDDRAGLKVARLKDFAISQAQEAQYLFNRLTLIQQDKCELTPTLWRNLFRDTTMWRYLHAQQTGGHKFGIGLTVDPSRFLTPITDDEPNIDRLGRRGRLKADSMWNEELQIWTGGTPTPASRISEHLGELALARFDKEGVTGDELQNVFVLPVPGIKIVNGNRIVRGDVAKKIVRNQMAHYERERGKAAVRLMDTEVEDAILCINGTAADRNTIFSAAMNELAKQIPGECDNNTLANIAYLLYQAPQTKRGSDAVIRTFLVGAGSFLTGKTFIMPQDIDLRAYVLGQRGFIDYFVGANQQRDTLTSCEY